MSKLILVCALLGTLSIICTEAQLDKDVKQLFEQFKTEYGKNYNGDDEERRFEIFKDNLKRAEELQRTELGTAEYGVTQFSDLTPEEFKSKYLTLRVNDLELPEKMAEIPQIDNMADEVDWRKKGAVNPVEDQGSCGSCYSFSVVANIEGQWFLKKGKLLRLSKQQVVDCDKVDHGCDGGWPPNTYKEIKRMGGLQNFSDYPYNGRVGKCRLDKSRIAAKIDDSVTLGKSETEQAKWLAKNGPMSTGLNSDHLQSYKKGIHQPSSCPASGVNHAVLTVGYGTEGGKPYWIVKNTWGPRWGESGYFRIYRGNAVCGINSICTSAVIR